MPKTQAELIKQEHPDYASMSAKWQFFADAAAGGVDYPGKANPLSDGNTTLSHRAGESGTQGRYLWQHLAEASVDFIHRLNRAVTPNICAPVIDFMAATIGAQDKIKLNLGSKDLDAIRDDFDLQGASYQQFMAAPRKSAMTYGHTFLVVDATATDQQIVTVADQRRLKIRPYVYEVTPPDLLNWRVSADGSFEEVIFRVAAPLTGGLLEEPVKDADPWLYMHWTRSTWTKYRIEGSNLVLLDQRPNTLGVVAVCPLYYSKRGPCRSESLIHDAAKTMQSIVNGFSAQDEAYNRQMFAIPVVESEESPSTVGVGISTILHLKLGEKFYYASPDVAPFAVGIDWLYRLVMLADKQMGIAPTSISDVTQMDQQSGTAKAWDNREASNIMAAMAINEQECAKVIWYWIKLYLGIAAEVGVEYMTTYDLETVTDGITRVIQFQAASFPPTVVKEAKKKVIAKELPSLADDVRALIDAELEQVPSEPVAADVGA